MASDTAVNAQQPARKVLVIMSGADRLQLREENRYANTGYFLVELYKPLKKLFEAGFTPIFANPTGIMPAMDPFSDSVVWFFGSRGDYKEAHRMVDDIKRTTNFAAPDRFSEIADEDLDQYVGVFIPGGHAPMEDLVDDRELGRILKYFHERGKPIGALCHGPIALLSTRLASPEGRFAFEGYQMTVYSNWEEKATELLLRGTVPFYCETRLGEAGARMKENWPLLPKVTVDRELITAQGPSSAGSFGEKFVQTLQAH